MDISLDEFIQFEKTCNYKFKRVFEQPGIMSIERFKLSRLSRSKYIYIYDHYQELQKHFNREDDINEKI